MNDDINPESGNCKRDLVQAPLKRWPGLFPLLPLAPSGLEP